MDFPLKISGKERPFQEITLEIRNLSKRNISKWFFVSNNFVSEGIALSMGLPNPSPGLDKNRVPMD